MARRTIYYYDTMELLERFFPAVMEDMLDGGICEREQSLLNLVGISRLDLCCERMRLDVSGGESKCIFKSVGYGKRFYCMNGNLSIGYRYGYNSRLIVLFK